MQPQTDYFILCLEIAYYIASIMIAVAAIFGLQQLKILKRDINTRNERSAKEKAIEFSSLYLKEYVKLEGIYFFKLRENNIPGYSGPIKDFSPDSVLPEYKKIQLLRSSHLEFLPALNRLESISAAFTSGVADEVTGFKIIGRTFCATVASNYDIISISRTNSIAPYWSNIVELFYVWSKRLTKAELDAERNKLEEQVNGISDIEIKPIGVDKI